MSAVNNLLVWVTLRLKNQAFLAPALRSQLRSRAHWPKPDAVNTYEVPARPDFGALSHLYALCLLTFIVNKPQRGRYYATRGNPVSSNSPRIDIPSLRRRTHIPHSRPTVAQRRVDMRSRSHKFHLLCAQRLAHGRPRYALRDVALVLHEPVANGEYHIATRCEVVALEGRCFSIIIIMVPTLEAAGMKQQDGRAAGCVT